jgi:hypothetical protein
VKAVFVGQQTYLVLPKPMDFSVVEARRELTETYLCRLMKQYYEMLPGLGIDAPLPIVRANVLLVTKKWKGVFGTYLKPYYSCMPDAVLPEEWDLKWTKNNGIAGWAWRTKKITPYDSVEQPLRYPGRGLTKHQREVLGHLNSVLAIPILQEGKFVGLLVLDSKENVARTKFNKSEVYTLASQAAKVISGQFDPTGVAA